MPDFLTSITTVLKTQARQVSLSGRYKSASQWMKKLLNNKLINNQNT